MDANSWPEAYQHLRHTYVALCSQALQPAHSGAEGLHVMQETTRSYKHVFTNTQQAQADGCLMLSGDLHVLTSLAAAVLQGSTVVVHRTHVVNKSTCKARRSNASTCISDAAQVVNSTGGSPVHQAIMGSGSATTSFTNRCMHQMRCYHTWSHSKH
jgi:hypothetical protein